MLGGSFPVFHAVVCFFYLVTSEVCQRSLFHLTNHVEMSTFVNFLKGVISNEVSDEKSCVYWLLHLRDDSKNV